MLVVDSKELYAHFLLSDFWINLSRQLRRQRKACQQCGSTRNLQCHHLRYTDNLFDVQLSDLQVLCRSCHESTHGIGQPKPTAQPNSPKTFSEAKFMRGRGLITRQKFMQFKRQFLGSRRSKHHHPNPKPKNTRRFKSVKVWWPGKYEGKAPGEVREQWAEIVRKAAEERAEKKRKNREKAQLEYQRRLSRRRR